jgi:hypothetical protein
VKFVFIIINIIEALFRIQQAYAGPLFIQRIKDCIPAEKTILLPTASTFILITVERTRYKNQGGKCNKKEGA